jgi:acetyl esterase
MPATFNVYGQFETSRSEEELFMRKLRDSGVATSTFMNRGVGHDVIVWGSVEGDLTAHKKAIEFLNAAFEASK